MAFEEFGMEDDVASSLGNDNAKRFKVEDGKEYILSFAWWPEDDDGKPDMTGSPRFVKADRVYIEKCGNVLYEGPEYAQYSKGGEEPRTYVGTVVVQWPVVDGKIDKTALRSKRWSVLPFIMSEGKFAQIRSQHNRFSLGEYDLYIKCPKGGSQYQQMTFSPSPGNTLSSVISSSDKVWKILQAQIEAAIPKVKSEIGKKMTIAQILEKRGEEGAQPLDLGVSDTDIDDELDGIIDDD